MRKKVKSKSKVVKAKKRSGRPPRTLNLPPQNHTKFDEKIALEILERLEKGETLTKICSDEHIPGISTVWYWTEKSPVFFDRYYKAHKIGRHVRTDDTLEIAADTSKDILPGVHGSQNGNSAAVQRAKLRIENIYKYNASTASNMRMRLKGRDYQSIANGIIEALISGEIDAEKAETCLRAIQHIKPEAAKPDDDKDVALLTKVLAFSTNQTPQMKRLQAAELLAEAEAEDPEPKQIENSVVESKDDKET